MNTLRQELAALVKAGFTLLGYDHPTVLLADAALAYNSTAAHNERAMSAAYRALSAELSDAPEMPDEDDGSDDALSTTGRAIPAPDHHY